MWSFADICDLHFLNLVGTDIKQSLAQVQFSPKDGQCNELAVKKLALDLKMYFIHWSIPPFENCVNTAVYFCQ